MGNLFYYIFIPVGLWIFLSCNAPRNNPFDPQNPGSPFSVLEGKIQTFSVPRQNLSEVTVLWENEDVRVLSNETGQFTIEKILPQDGWVIFNKSGYHRDSLQIQWGALKRISLDHFLNALPQLDSLDVFSVVTNRHGSPQKFEVVLRSGLSDADNDIDSVLWSIPELDQTGFLQFDASDNLYKSVFETFLLPNEEIVGHDFVFTVKDLFETKVVVGRESIKRVIKQEAIPIFPLGGEMVSSMPQLRWQRFTPGFTHTYRLEVFEIIAFSDPLLTWEIEGVPPDSISFTVDSPLNAGEYFWVIWAIDEFKNRARSKPVTFVVE